MYTYNFLPVIKMSSCYQRSEDITVQKQLTTLSTEIINAPRETVGRWLSDRRLAVQLRTGVQVLRTLIKVRQLIPRLAD